MKYAKGDLVKVINNNYSGHRIPIGTEISITEASGVVCFVVWSYEVWGLYEPELEPAQRVGDMEIDEGTALNLIDATLCQKSTSKLPEKTTLNSELKKEMSTIGGSSGTQEDSLVSGPQNRPSSPRAGSFKKSTKSRKKSKHSTSMKTLKSK